MIKRITIRDVASYDSEGVVFDDLQKVNFVFGGNGTGKTTISRVLEEQNVNGVRKCRVIWDGKKRHIYVYNKDFRDRNFGEYIPGIFTLGENVIEAEREIEILQTEQEKMMKRAGEVKMKVEAYEKLIKEEEAAIAEKISKEVYDIYRKKYGKCLKEHLNSAEAGQIIVEGVTHRGNMLLYPSPSTEYHSETEIKQAYSMLYGDPKLNYLREFYKVDKSIDQLVEISEDPIWMKRVVGSEDVAIGHLIEELGMADWVRQGQQKLEEDSDVCPFCQQHTITKGFKKELEKFFDEEYEKAASRILELELKNSAQVQNMLRELDEMKRVIQEQEIEERDFLNVKEFASNAQRLTEMVWSNTRQIMAKKSEPSRRIEMLNIREVAEALKQQIKRTNRTISAYNIMMQNQEREREALYGVIWNNMLLEASGDVEVAQKKIKAYKKQQKICQEEYDKAFAEYKRIGELIKEKHEGVISMQPTVDRINSMLNQFGFHGFRLHASPKKDFHYQIERTDGTLAKDTLSEGEVTFITFLYFMHLVKGIERDANNNEPRIVVIDDPISSLDNQAIVVVSMMVKELINEARLKDGRVEQIIVLTHNKAFHKNISERQVRRDTYYWKLLKPEGVSKVTAYKRKNPVEGDYEEMWEELKRKKANMKSKSMQNLMRKIIETYFVGFGGYNKRKLFDGEYVNNEDRISVISLAKWLDEGSHRTSDDMYSDDDESENRRYLGLFKRMFEVMGHSEHYNMMMREDVHHHE